MCTPAPFFLEEERTVSFLFLNFSLPERTEGFAVPRFRGKEERKEGRESKVNKRNVIEKNPLVDLFCLSFSPFDKRIIQFTAVTVLNTFDI